MGGPFEARQRLLFGSQGGLVFIESLEVGRQARVTVALGLEHGPLEFVFSRAGLVFDPLEALFLAGLVGLADADLAVLVVQLGGFPGGCGLGFGLAARLGGLAGQLLEAGLAPHPLPGHPDPQIVVDFVGPGGQVAHGASEALEEFKGLAGSGIAIHSHS